MRKMRPAAACFLFGVAVLFALPAASQSLNFSSTNSRVPIEIFADNGIEWQQENLIFIARGNARAVRGKTTIYAQTLRAYYREGKGGSTEISRIDAETKVRIVTPAETGYSEKAVYDVDKGVVVMTGGRVRLVSGLNRIEADGQIEYWERKQMIVARRGALAVRVEKGSTKKLYADVLAAYFSKDKKGKTSIYRVEAFDNVRIVTGKDKVRADRSVYNVKSGIATLTGNVRISRAGSELNGCSAEVNMNTGVSTLYSCGSAEGGRRVRGVIVPKPNAGKGG
jgi:lipopolysaccharide export system protein LptA